jgi:hypothetical protein
VLKNSDAFNFKLGRPMSVPVMALRTQRGPVAMRRRPILAAGMRTI